MKLFVTESGKVTELITKSFWKCFGIGLLITIAFIPSLILLAITIVGIPLVGLVLLLSGLYAYLSTVAVAVVAGQWLVNRFNWKQPAYGVFVIGLVGIYILKLIPFIGFLTGLVILWTGLGAFSIRFVTKK